MRYVKCLVCLGDTTEFSLRLLVRALALTHTGPWIEQLKAHSCIPQPVNAFCCRRLPHPRVHLHSGASPWPVTWVLSSLGTPLKDHSSCRVPTRHQGQTIQSANLSLCPILTSSFPYMSIPLKQWFPAFSGTRDQFHGRQFFHRWGVEEMVSGWFKCITLLCTLFLLLLLLLYQLHLRLSGIRS